MPTFPVAVHRFFERGANWVCHPELFKMRDFLISALKDPIKSTLANEHIFCLVDRGALVGEKYPDPDCPDPKARNPFIIWVALVGDDFLQSVDVELERLGRKGETQDFVTDKVIRRLRALQVPTRSGQDPTLEIRFDPVRSSRTDPDGPSRPMAVDDSLGGGVLRRDEAVKDELRAVIQELTALKDKYQQIATDVDQNWRRVKRITYVAWLGILLSIGLLANSVPIASRYQIALASILLLTVCVGVFLIGDVTLSRSRRRQNGNRDTR